MQNGVASSRVVARASSDDGFTLIEVTVASILVVVVSLAFASSFSTAFGATRGTLLRQQATAIMNEELEYVRALDWDEVAQTYVDTSAPMLTYDADSLDGYAAGFAGYEVLAVFPDTGAITPLRTYVVDGVDYTVWRYVSHSTGGLRRFVVLITWVDEGASETLLGSTWVSQVTARANPGSVTTTVPGSTTTSSSTSTTSTTTTTSTSTTTTTTPTSTTTTTTLPPFPELSIEPMELVIDYGNDKQTANVFVKDDVGQSLNGATVYGVWSMSPEEAGYPFDVSQVSNGPGRATFIHNDGHPDGVTVQFCVTNVVMTGFSYLGGLQCASGPWGA